MLCSLLRAPCPSAVARRLVLPLHACCAASRLFSSRPSALEGDARTTALAELASTGWELQEDRDAIQKVYQFDDFIGAFGWMTQVGLVSRCRSSATSSTLSFLGECFLPEFSLTDQSVAAGKPQVAEKMDHHPEWFNVYGTVDVVKPQPAIPTTACFPGFASDRKLAALR